MANILSAIKKYGLPAWSVGKKLLLPITFLIIALAVGAIGILNLYTTAYAVTIDGEEWGIIYNKADAESAVRTVEEEVSGVLGYSYELGEDVECEEVFVLKTHVTADPDELETLLYDNVTDITDSYILRVDGETVGIGDEEELNDLVDEVSSQYSNENTVSVRILSDVEISYETVPTEMEKDPNVMSDTLTEVKEDEITCEVSETKTLEEVAEEMNVSASKILTLNPELALSAESLEDMEDLVEPDKTEDLEQTEKSEETETTEESKQTEETKETDTPENSEESSDNKSDETADSENIGNSDENSEETVSKESESEDEDENNTPAIDVTTIDPSDVVVEENTTITVEPEKSLLVVETQDVETHEEELEYATIVEEDDTMYVDETEIREEGHAGKAKVTETITKLNGKEVERVQSNYEITDEIVDQVIAVGTKEPEPVAREITVENDEGNTVTYVEGTTYSTGYMWPLQNYGMNCITSHYGWRTLNGSADYHPAIDISAPAGTPVLATADGTVIACGYGGDRGYFVQIDHGNGVQTISQHFCEPSYLSVGDEVAQGQVIGYVGSTGYSFGNHLHFEVLVANGKSWPDNTIDPLILFTDPDSLSIYAPVSISVETSVEEETAEEGEEPESEEDNLTLKEQLVEYAESYIGCPYVHGGHGDTTYQVSDLITYANSAYKVNIPYNIDTSAGVRSYLKTNYDIDMPLAFDCSGFTEWIYKHFGYEIYYTVEAQMGYGSVVSADVSEMEPGDLIFFATTGTGKATHVGMYVGDGQYIHASSTYGQVMLDTVRSTANRPIVAVRRIIQ